MWGMAVAERRGLQRATVAVARKLAVIMHRILADGSDFRWSRDDPAEATSVVPNHISIAGRSGPGVTFRQQRRFCTHLGNVWLGHTIEPRHNA